MLQRNRGYAGDAQEAMDQEDYLMDRIRNMVLSSPGLQIGTTSKKAVRINATTVYLKDGIFKSKAAAEIAFTATTHDIAANASSVQECIYLLTINAAGTVTITKGDVATGSGNAKIPELPAQTDCVLGYVRIAVAAGSTIFDATSDDLDAAHLTVTYYSTGFLGARFDAVQ